jgi:hypothetical protein
MWTFVPRLPSDIRRISFDSVKSVCDEIINMEKTLKIEIKGDVTISSMTDKNSFPIACEKYIVNSELIIPYYSPLNLLEVVSSLRNAGFAENRITQISVYKVGWFNYWSKQ